VESFREAFNYQDRTRYSDLDIKKALRYGAERVNLESGGTISGILDGKEFPHGLTREQENTVKEAVGWCANHMLKQGQEWLRGSYSISMGQMSTSQTNESEPDYFPQWIKAMLVQAGLIKNIQTGSIPTEQSYDDFNDWAQKVEATNQLASRDFLAKAYIAKKGKNSLVSKDGTITIRPSGVFTMG